MASEACSYCPAQLDDKEKRDEHERAFHPAKGKASKKKTAAHKAPGTRPRKPAGAKASGKKS